MDRHTDNTSDWHTLGAFRGCDAHEHDHGISYIATMETTGPTSVLAALELAQREGMRCTFDDWHDEGGPNLHHKCYAVLDIRNETGDVIGDRCIPTPEVFAWWTHTVELRCDMSDCDVDEPEACARTYAWLDSLGKVPVARSAAILLGDGL